MYSNYPSVLALSALFLVAVAHAACPTTDPITFVAPGSFTNAFAPGSPIASETYHEFSYADNQTLVGFEAALMEANDDPVHRGVAGRPLRVTPVEVQSAHTAFQPGNLQRLARLFDPADPVYGNATAVIGSGAPLAPYSLAFASQRPGTPLVGSYAYGPAAYREGATSVIHLRTSVMSEVLGAVNFAVNSHLACKRFLYFTIPMDDSRAAVNVGVEAIRALSLPEPTVIETRMARDGAAYVAWLRTVPAILSNLTELPHMVQFMVDQLTMKVIIEAFTSHPRYVPGQMHFVSHSFSGLEVYRDSKGGTQRFDSLYYTSALPFPQDTSYDIVRSYQAAVAKFKASGRSTVLVDESPNIFAMDGYNTGRFVVNTLRNMDPSNITRRGFIEKVFANKMAGVDDLLFGPYSAGCTGAAKSSSSRGACWCNAGSRMQLVLKVNGSTGKLGAITAVSYREPEENLQATLALALQPIPLDKCSLERTLVPEPLVVPALFDEAAVAADASALPSADLRSVQQRIVGSAAAELGAAGGAKGTLRVLLADNQTTTTAVAASRYKMFATAADFLPRPSSARRAEAETTAAELRIAPLPLSLRFADRDPDTVPFTSFDASVIPLLPTMADFVHTAAAYAAHQGRQGGAWPDAHRRIAVLAETDALAALACRSVESFGHPSAAVTVAGSNPQADAEGLASAAGLAAFPRRVVIVAAHSPALVKAALQAATSTAGQGSVFIVCPSELLMYHASSMTPSTASTHVALPAAGPNVLFASALPPASSMPNDIVAAYGLVVARALRSVYDQDGSTAQRTSGSGASPSLEAVFKFGSLTAQGVVLEPLSNVSCGLTAPQYPHPGGACQCAKGLTKFFLFNHTAASATAGKMAFDFSAAEFLYKHDGCGVKYIPLPTATEDETSLLLVALISVAGVLLVVAIATPVLLWLCRRPGRNTAAAPKDSDTPFAVVFTDIQASTTLWALAPGQMGPGVDLHHSVLRSLVADHKGYEVKTIGDSFMVAFKDVNDAVRFALATQAGLYKANWGTEVFDHIYDDKIYDAHPQLPRAVRMAANHALWCGLRVRVGVHYGLGEVVFDEASGGYDYYGTVVNTAARVEGVGHGGQVILSKAAHAALDARGLGEGFEAVYSELGPQPLRGLPDPIDLVQVLPQPFSSRQFAPLRLDVEIVVDEPEASLLSGFVSGRAASIGEQSGRGTVYSVSKGTSEPPSSSMDSRQDSATGVVARRFLARSGCQVPFEVLSLVAAALETVHSPDTKAKQASAVKAWVAAWRLPKLSRADQRLMSHVAPDDVSRLRVALRVVESMQATGRVPQAMTRRVEDVAVPFVSLCNTIPSVPTSPAEEAGAHHAAADASGHMGQFSLRTLKSDDFTTK